MMDSACPAQTADRGKRSTVIKFLFQLNFFCTVDSEMFART